MNTPPGSRETGLCRREKADSGQKRVCQPPAAFAKAPSNKIAGFVQLYLTLIKIGSR
jgi:hypothetical protein